MTSLTFFTGPMDCGKSTMALQVDHTQRGVGRQGRLFTAHDRSGTGRITSRIGLERDAVEVGDDFDLWGYVVGQLSAGHRIDYLICDEAQFYTTAQIDALARIVDDLEIDVFAFGILTDFRTELFAGSRRLVELCDRFELLPVQPLCWCGARGTHTARTRDGHMVTEGAQVVVGDTGTGAGEIGYEVLCRRHHRRGVTRASAGAAVSVDPLPYDDPAELDPVDELDPALPGEDAVPDDDALPDAYLPDEDADA